MSFDINQTCPKCGSPTHKQVGWPDLETCTNPACGWIYTTDRDVQAFEETVNKIIQERN